MKKITLLVLLSLSTIIYSQSNKNYNFCREVITANKDYSVRTTFLVNPNEIDNKIEQIRINLFSKKSIYYIKTSSNKTKLHIYHLSEVNFEDIKLLIENLDISSLNFQSTSDIDFKSKYSEVLPISTKR